MCKFFNSWTFCLVQCLNWELKHNFWERIGFPTAGKILQEIPWGPGGKSRSKPLEQLCLSALFIKHLLNFILFISFMADNQIEAVNKMFIAAV